MISKNHRQNSNFQILYFLVGSCFTHDAAYSLLQDLKEERETAVEHYYVTKIREKAKRLKISKQLSSEDEVEKLEGEADLLELENSVSRGEILYQAAMDELNFINDCMTRIKPLCKYKDLPEPEANQAMQQEEWKLELIHRAENCLLTTGTISTDHFATMRMHPEFDSVIFPTINELTLMIQDHKRPLSLQNKNLLEN